MTRTVVYCRVSLDKQAEKGVSLDAQQAKARAYARFYDLDIVEVVIDAGVSAKTLARPGLERALGLLKSGKAEALVVKLDRLTRSVADLGKLVERYFAPGKAALLSVGEQIDTRSGGRLVLNVLASVSQWEREAIGERTSAALQHKASRGEYTGGTVPYGYRLAADGERLEPHLREQALLAHARRLRRKGLSLRAVARESWPRVSVRGQADPSRRCRCSGCWREQEIVMADSKKMTAFRLDEALLKRLDRYADRLAKETGLPVNRADVVRLLLTRSLDAAEQESARSRR